VGGIGKRESLVKAADTLFHRKGFEHTSIADIAEAAKVPVGNVYYYFKTRGDLVKAVTEQRLASVQAMRAEWDSLPSPRDRLLAYVGSFESRIEERTAHGCPAGSLCQEANKQGGTLAEDASAVFRSSLEWMRVRFRAMGCPDREARANAARILGGWQGSILLSNTFKDPVYMRQEIARIKEWLKRLPAGKERKEP
jgi:AcrR family transcriptional regulator